MQCIATIRQVLAGILILLALPVSTRAQITIDSDAQTGEWLSMAFINGNPAVAYFDDTHDALKYVRALDPWGINWGTPVHVDMPPIGEYAGYYPTLLQINARPAIAYRYVTSSSGELRYVRALDGTGDLWGTPVTVAGNNAGNYASMSVLNGNPSIAYTPFGGSGLYFVRANDNDGTTWGTPLLVDAAGTGFVSVADVSRRMAIAYQAGTALRYTRASNFTGSSWDTPINVATVSGNPRWMSMDVIDGNPAIAYTTTTPSAMYVRATDNVGSAWGTLYNIGASGVLVSNASLKSVGGLPGVALYTGNKLEYFAAADVAGAAWSGAILVENGGLVGSLLEIGGDWAVAYKHLSRTTLTFKRNPTALPVELTSFEAVRDGRDAVVTWTTASEANNSGFEVQHASGLDVDSWSSISFVPARAGFEEGGQYESRMTNLTPGLHRFRLKQVDRNGAFSFSPVVELRMVEGMTGITIAGANPFEINTVVSVSVPSTQDVAVELFDVTGRRVRQLFDGQVTADNAIAVDVSGSGLPAGMYFVRVSGPRIVDQMAIVKL